MTSKCYHHCFLVYYKRFAANSIVSHADRKSCIVISAEIFAPHFNFGELWVFKFVFELNIKTMKKTISLLALLNFALLSVFAQFSQSSIESKTQALREFNNDSIFPPENLQAELNNNDVSLTWMPPGDGPGIWFTWSDSVSYTAIGLTDGGTFQVAARWDQEQLYGFDGEFLSKVEFIPASTTAGFILRIWKGTNAAELIYQQVVEVNDSLEWKEIILDQPVEIDETEELWVGFKINHLPEDFPMACDAGPAVANFGDMIQVDSAQWLGANVYGLDLNWNIRAFISQTEEPLGPKTEIELPAMQMQGPAPSGYNVYRNDELLTSTPIVDLEYLDENLENGFYTYGVTAIYDTVESDPALADVLIGGPELSIFPDSLYLETVSDSISETDVTLINTGAELLTWTAESEAGWLSPNTSEGEIQPGDSLMLTLTVDASGLLAGVYLALVEFSTNNPNNPLTYLTVLLNVTGNAEITIDPDSLDFGYVLVNEPGVQQLMIMNTGTDDLFVTGIESSSTYFTVDEQEFYMNPGENVFLNVTFTPDEVTDYSATLTIFSNANQQTELEVNMAGSGTLAPPLNLQGTEDEGIVSLSWLNPGGGPGTWLYYGDGSVSSAIGLTDGGVWQIAARWEANQLDDYEGEYLVKTQFYFFTGVAEYTLKIWEVDSLPVLIVDQYIGLIEDSLTWVEVFLDEPLLIDGETELLIGYEINQEFNAFPAGVDFGPAVVGYGDLVRFEGDSWGNLSDYGLDFNWSIQAFISGEEGEVSLPQTVGTNNLTLNADFSVTHVDVEMVPSSFSAFRDLLGYHVYRNDILLNNETISETTYQDTLPEAGTYDYTVTAVYDEGESQPAGPLTFTVDSLLFYAPEGWQLVESEVHHFIMIDEGIINHPENSLQPGDWAGAFFAKENELILAGMAMWDGNDTEMVTFGDHYLTPEKDGFIDGDTLIWKIFRADDEREYRSEAIYDENMPNADGTFEEDGLSALKALKIIAPGIDENSVFEAVNIFPIPANREINLVGLPVNTRIQIFAMDGRKMTEAEARQGQQQIELSGFQKGNYLMLMTNGNHTASRLITVN
jgi:hypothetical protein